MFLTPGKIAMYNIINKINYTEQLCNKPDGFLFTLFTLENWDEDDTQISCTQISLNRQTSKHLSTMEPNYLLHNKR